MGVGIANVLGGLLLLQTGFQVRNMPPAQFREQLRKMSELGLSVDPAGPEAADAKSEELQALLARLYMIWAGLSLIGAFLTTYGGYNLRTVNSYRLAVCGSILGAVPCTSPTSCCGIGIIVSAWALIVLMSRDVRAAFP
jgi:hypothetical protein